MQKQWSYLIPGFLTLSFLTPLAAHAYVGSYSRFMADDYCSAYMAGTRGLFGATFYWYMHWTGRYSANFLDSLAGLLGPKVSPFIPALAILIWGFVLAAALFQLKLAAQNRARLLLAVLLAALVLFTTLSNTPLVSQSLYWGQGMRSLAPPLILLVAYGGFLAACWQLPDRSVRLSPFRYSLMVGVSFGTAFVAAGFSETGAVLLVALLALLLMAGFFTKGPEFRQRMLPLVAAGLLGSLLALAVIVVAPGNIAREDFYPRHPGFFRLVKITLHSVQKFFLQAGAMDAPFDLQGFVHQFLNLAGVMILPALIGLGLFGGGRQEPGLQKKWHLLLFGVPLAAGLLILTCFVPAAYALSSGPPNRTKIIPDFVLISSLAFWGYVLGRILNLRLDKMGFFSRKRYLDIALVAICALFAFNAVWDSARVIGTAPAFQRYAAAWDQNHQKILDRRADGRAHVIVQALRNPAGLEEITPKSRFWVNQCASDYYGVRVTASKNPEQNLPPQELTGSNHGQ